MKNSAVVKIPPNNIEAEQRILGACFIARDKSIIQKISRIVEPADFYREAHQILFQGICEVGEALDEITLNHWLVKNRLLEKAGGPDYITSLWADVSTSAGWEYHANIIKDCSKRRRLIRECSITAEACFDRSIDVKETQSNHEKALMEMDLESLVRYRRGIHISNVYTPERMIEAYSEYIETLKQNRFITGIHEIDRRIRGVAGGEVLYIIARAGSFKTAMLQNLLKNYIDHSAWGAAMFEIEMPVSSMTERYMQIIIGSTGREIEEHYTSKAEGFEQYKKCLEEDFISSLQNLFIIPTQVTVQDIQKYIPLIEKHFKIKIGVIGIDYLGLMEGPGRGEYEITSNLAKDIKNLAKLLNLPVIVLCQTSREAGSDGTKEITLTAGRGSGAIEENADFALGMFQSDNNDLICKILKNRKGRKGSKWRLNLNPDNFRIGHEATEWDQVETKNSSRGMD